jgi:hypothetical protein
VKEAQVLVMLCRECVGAVLKTDNPGAFCYVGTTPNEGCWRCGVTGAMLAPFGLILKTDDGEAYYHQASGAYLHRTLAGPSAGEEDDDDDE